MEWALEQVELAERETPVCDLCGGRTVAVGHEDGTIWLECASVGTRKPTWRELLPLVLTGGHTRRLVYTPRSNRSAA